MADGEHGVSPSSSPPPPPIPRFISASIPTSSSSSFTRSPSVPSLLLRCHPHFSDSFTPQASDPQISSLPSAPLPSQTPGSAPTGSGSNGVVVIGAVGRSQEDVAQLLNRILDHRVFRPYAGDGSEAFMSGDESANRDVGVASGKAGEAGGAGREGVASRESRGRERLGWIKRHLQHYYDEERGVVYVMFSWDSLPLDCVGESEVASRGLAVLLEQREADGLRGLLFMFSVCHIILFIQDGAHFEPKMLQVFRILQAAKHSFASYVKMQVLPGLVPSPSARIQPLRPASLSTSSSPGRGIVGRQGSVIALMSGSAPTLFPGQCSPVLLFVCFEDFSDLSSENIEVVSTSSNFSVGNTMQANPSVHGLRQVSPSKPPVQILTARRPASKMEAGQRKKFQSSVEAQIRFLIKRCRVITGSGDGGALGSGGSGMGPRASGSIVGPLPGISGGGALFTLDPTRAVVFLERSANRSVEALDAIIDVMENVFRADGNTDFLSELSNSATGGDEIQHLRDLLWRQIDILRGKGGLSSNTSGGSAGVGMVAAAAAAAAASAASAGTSGGSTGSGKLVGSHPELPSLGIWLSACRLIVDALMTTEGRMIEEGGQVSAAGSSGIRIMVKKSASVATDSTKAASSAGASQSRATVELALGYLESSKDINMKFSATWCKKALPSALEIYKKDLPPCYPTALHLVHLQRALQAFQKMVRGPAVFTFLEKLKEDCEKVWKSGRRLCDAVSLTGKPCIYQVHEASDLDKTPPPVFARESRSRISVDEMERRIVKPHCSGIVFLHACACGRSRRLREDPFDYESANVNFFQFPDCEYMLPRLILPGYSGNMHSRGQGWSLVCLGNARYYQPSLGLLQDGFCSKQNILSPWFISVRCRKKKHLGMLDSQDQDDSCISFTNTHESVKSARQNLLMHSSPKSGSITDKTDVKEHLISPSRVPITSSAEGAGPLFVKGSMYENKKASVAGELMVTLGEDSAFPPLPQRKERRPVTKVFRNSNGKNKKEPIQSMLGENAVAIQEGLKEPTPSTGGFEVSVMNGVGTHIELPLFTNKNELAGSSREGLVAINRTEQTTIYIGFEHECPYGHRFFLSVDQVKSLGGVYSEGQDDAHSLESSQDYLKQERVLAHTIDHLFFANKQMFWPHSDLEHIGIRSEEAGDSASKLSDMLQSFDIHEGFGEGLSLLGSNLPIYIKCPHCKASDGNIRKNGLVFAGQVSQLQRIFLVTPSFPIVLASRPVVQFEASYFSKQIKKKLEFSIGCEILLPPESFLSLRLPFVYSAELDNTDLHSLTPKVDHPEHTAWLVKGTALFIASKGSPGLLNI